MPKAIQPTTLSESEQTALRLVIRVQARVVNEIETRAFTHLAGSENDKFLRKMGKSGA